MSRPKSSAHIAALSEIYVVLRLMGFNIGIVGALIFEALTKLVNVVGLINPGNVGTYEGGNILIARMFGLGADTGMVSPWPGVFGRFSGPVSASYALSC